MSLRAALHRQLEPSARERPGLSTLNKALVAAIVVSTGFAILETEPALRRGREGFFRGVDLAFAALFAVEYAARFWTAAENVARRGLRGRLAWALSPMALVDLVAVVSLAAPLADGDAVLLRLLRILRILKLARLGRFSTAAAALAQAVRDRSWELAAGAAVAGLLLLVSATLLYLVEGGVQPEAFGSIPRAMWWSVATLTTVGYGDVFPVTPLGRLLAGATAIAGIGLIALPTGILAAAFSDAVQREKRGGE